MKILLYNNAFSPSIGGVETLVQLVARYLQSQGEEVTVVTQTPTGTPMQFPFRVVRQPSNRTLARLISEANVVHIHSFHPLVFLQSKLRRRKIVCSYHDLTLICPNGTKMKIDGPCLHTAGPRVCFKCLQASKSERVFARLVRPISKTILSFFMDANLCGSRFQMQRFRLWRKQLVPYGIETSLFEPPSELIDATLPQVVFAGRLVPEKGCHVAIESLRLCVQAGLLFDLHIAGQGPEYSKLVELVASHGLEKRVHFLQTLERPKLAELMRKADAVIVPSVYDEIFGLVAIEAFSCGRPVVAADVGGLGEVVAEAGVTFQRGNAQDLAARLTELLKKPSLQQELGTKARMLAVQKYDYRIMAAAYHDLYRRLLHGRARPSGQSVPDSEALSETVT